MSLLISPALQSALPALLKGAAVSMQLVVCAMALSIPLGLLLGLLGTLGISLLNLALRAYTSVICGTPMIIQIVFASYFLPQLGLKLPAFAIASIAIGLNSAAYLSEIVRAALLSVSSGQKEAAVALGLSKLQTLRYIVFPQALRTMIPAFSNEMITLTKDSALASIIGVVELYKQARSIISQTYDVVPIFAATALFYLIATLIIKALSTHLERKMSWYVKH
jgi:His/Glu/Gln/Arg/opine family amino acid ABC transporter permease subunit